MQVIIMPAGSASALKHYDNTIGRPVPLEVIGKYVDDAIVNRLRDGKRDAIAVWGFTPGGDERNVVRWNKIQTGAVAIFGGQGSVRSCGTVVYKARLPKLAAELWGSDSAGGTWEYIIFLDDVKDLEIAYTQLNEAASYAPKYFIRAFEVLDPDRSASVIAALPGWLGIEDGSDRELLKETLAEEEEKGSFNPPNSEVESKRRTLASIFIRRGQPQFRASLIKAYGGKCAISGCDLLDALEAAHIVPYSGEGTNDISNGLLLRADLHTLLDLGLLAIHPESMTVALSVKIAQSAYREFTGKQITLPHDAAKRPSKYSLQTLWAKSGCGA